MAAREFTRDERYVPFRCRNVLINIGVKVVYHWNMEKNSNWKYWLLFCFNVNVRNFMKRRVVGWPLLYLLLLFYGWRGWEWTWHVVWGVQYFAKWHWRRKSQNQRRFCSDVHWYCTDCTAGCCSRTFQIPPHSTQILLKATSQIYTNQP